MQALGLESFWMHLIEENHLTSEGSRHPRLTSGLCSYGKPARRPDQGQDEDRDEDQDEDADKIRWDSSGQETATDKI